MANRWETMETVTDFIFLGYKITANGDRSHEMKRCLPFGRKTMTNLVSILKSRDITDKYLLQKKIVKTIQADTPIALFSSYPQQTSWMSVLL